LADSSKTLIDLGFVVMERLDGKSLVGLEPALDRSDTYAIYAQMGRVLREIHAIMMDSFGYIGASLCHFDFHTGNVLAARHGGSLRLTGIVDLENPIAGDPPMDLAKTIAYSVRDDETKRAGLLAGYGPIDRRNWRETMMLYQLYGAIELWAWWTQIGDHQRATSIIDDLERYG